MTTSAVEEVSCGSANQLGSSKPVHYSQPVSGTAPLEPFMPLPIGCAVQSLGAPARSRTALSRTSCEYEMAPVMLRSSKEIRSPVGPRRFRHVACSVVWAVDCRFYKRLDTWATPRVRERSCRYAR